MRDYDREKQPIALKYKSDPAIYYRKVLHFRAKGVEFTERAPPRNATEAAERAAKDTANAVNKGIEKTSQTLKKFDEQYQIQ